MGIRQSAEALEASGCAGIQRHRMSPEDSLRPAGLEPATPGLGNRCPKSVNRDGATSYESPDAALTDPLTELFRKDADPALSLEGLAAVISAWPGLPEAARARSAARYHQMLWIAW